jgi:hypothetical protein
MPPPSSSGPGRRVLIPVTGVRVPLGVIVGYPREVQREMGEADVKRSIILILLILAIGALLLTVTYQLTLRPMVTVDYAAMMDDLARPANYEPNKDGADLCHAAAKLLDDAGAIRIAGEDKRYSPSDILLSSNWPGNLSHDELSLLKSWLQKNSEGVALLEQAQTKEQFWPRSDQPGKPLWRVILYDHTGMVNGYRAVLWRGKLKAAEGHVQEGLDDIFAARNMGRFFGERPCMVEWMVRIAYETNCYKAVAVVLANTRLSEAELAAVAARVRALPPCEGSFADTLPFEECLAADMAQRFFSNNGKGDGTLLIQAVYGDATAQDGFIRPPGYYSPYDKTGAIKKALQMKVRSPSRAQVLENHHRFCLLWAKLCETPPYKPEYATYKAELAQLAEKDVLGLTDSLSVNKIATLAHRYVNHREGLLTIIAILRYRNATGQPPADLKALVDAGYLKELSLDEFTGKPLVYRVEGNDFTLYSVSENGIDDGGTSKDKLDDVYWPVENVSGRAAPRDADAAERTEPAK